MLLVRLLFLALVASTSGLHPEQAMAEDMGMIADLDDQIATARRDLEQAQSAYRLYANVEYPRQMHRIDREIVFAKALLESHRRRVREFERFDRLRYSHPLFISLENARLAETDASLRLQALQEERSLFRRSHTERLRLLRMELDSATDRLSRLLIVR